MSEHTVRIRFQRLGLVFLLGLLSTLTLGASKRIRTSTLKTTSSNSRKSSLFGGLEVRPSISTKTEDFSSENSVWLGAIVGENTKISYVQEIESAVDSTGSQSAFISDGSFRLAMSNLWKDEESGTTFSDQIRVYIPTLESKRNAGMVAAIRNYLTFSMPISDSVTFDISEVPILHLYSDSGFVGDSGLVANPTFENRFIIGPTINFSSAVSLGIPLHFYVKKFHDYDDQAASNDEWVPELWLNPEVTYSLGTFYLGAGYRTDNFLSADEAGTILADGVGNGVFQFVLGVSF